MPRTDSPFRFRPLNSRGHPLLRIRFGLALSLVGGFLPTTSRLLDPSAFTHYKGAVWLAWSPKDRVCRIFCESFSYSTAFFHRPCQIQREAGGAGIRQRSRPEYLTGAGCEQHTVTPSL